jgi:hypothetical protein
MVGPGDAAPWRKREGECPRTRLSRHCVVGLTSLHCASLTGARLHDCESIRQVHSCDRSQYLGMTEGLTWAFGTMFPHDWYV